MLAMSSPVFERRKRNRRVHAGHCFSFGDLFALDNLFHYSVIHFCPCRAGTDRIHVDVELASCEAPIRVMAITAPFEPA